MIAARVARISGIALLAALTAVAATAPGLCAQDSARSRRDTAHTNTPAARDQRYRYRLLGVYDDASGEPIAGVEVRDVLSGLSMQTSATGTVSLLFLPDGGSLVRLRKLGYEMQTFAVAISPTDTAPLTVTMHAGAQQLPTVSVRDSAPQYTSPELRGAEERMRSHAGGYFIDEATMRKNDASPLSTVLIRMPGLMSVKGPHGETRFVSSRTMCKQAFACRQPNCFPSTYVNGAPYPVDDFERLQAQDYAIAEYYPGGASVPPEYGGMNATCGVLLLWTRER